MFTENFEKTAGRTGATIGGAIPGMFGLGAPVGADEGRRLSSWGGALGGQIAGALGGALLTGRPGGSVLGAMAGGASGAHWAHGKNKSDKQKFEEAKHKLEMKEKYNKEKKSDD